MADRSNEIVGSLFGITPDLYERQLRAQDEERAIKMANLAPGARGAAMIQSGAAGLTRGLGGLLGAEDPQMKLISARQSIIGQLDQTDPASLLKGAQMLTQMGDQQGAFALADYARKAESEIAQARQRNAAAQRERLQGTDKDIQIANELGSLQDTLDQLKAQPASPERDRAMNLLTTRYTELQRLTTKPEQKDKYSAFGQTLIDAGLTPGTEPFQKRMLEYATEKAKGAAKGSGNVTIGGITIDSGAASKEAGKIIGANVANVEQQYSLQTAYKDALGLLDKGIYGGAFGPEKQFVAKYAGVGSPEKVVNTEVFMANIGEIVIPRLQQFGGNDSNEELKYLQNVVAGNQRLEPESMKRTLISAEKKVQKNIERLRQQTQAGQGGAQLPIGPVNAPTITPTKRLNLQTGKIENVKGD
jgi:hypothetical protein